MERIVSSYTLWGVSHDEVLVWVTGHWLEGPVEQPLLVEEGDQLGEQVQHQHTNNHFSKMPPHKLVQQFSSCHFIDCSSGGPPHCDCCNSLVVFGSCELIKCVCWREATPNSRGGGGASNTTGLKNECLLL